MIKKLKGTIIYGEFDVVKADPVLTKESVDRAIGTFKSQNQVKGKTIAQETGYIDVNGVRIA